MNITRKLLFGLSLFALTTTWALADEWIVDCNWGGDYATIQAAVNAAGNYDTITVWPCEYDEDVFVDVEGLTVRSTEVAAMGPNTIVRAFSIGFAPNSGPHSVTIEGFTVGSTLYGCGDGNGVGIESSGDYNTVAHNYVTDCSIGIRVNQGNVGNNVHHNLVEDTSGTGIEIEGYYDGCCGGSAGPGLNHNVHQNVVDDTGGEGCLYVWADYSQIHQNQVRDCSTGIKAVFSEGNHIFQNDLCNESIELFGADDSWVHQNTFFGGGNVSNLNNGGDGNRAKKNSSSGAACPIAD